MYILYRAMKLQHFLFQIIVLIALNEVAGFEAVYHSPTTQQVTGFHGEDLCDALGTTLITVRSQEENDFWQNICYADIRGRCLIGLRSDISGSSSSEHVEGSFYWVDGSTSNFTNWKDGQPNEVLSNPACAALNDDDGKWTDKDCNDADFGILCTYTGELIPSNIIVTPGDHHINVTFEVPDSTLGGREYTVVAIDRESGVRHSFTDTTEFITMDSLLNDRTLDVVVSVRYALFDTSVESEPITVELQSTLDDENLEAVITKLEDELPVPIVSNVTAGDGYVEALCSTPSQHDFPKPLKVVAAALEGYDFNSDPGVFHYVTVDSTQNPMRIPNLVNGRELRVVCRVYFLGYTWSVNSDAISATPIGEAGEPPTEVEMIDGWPGEERDQAESPEEMNSEVALTAPRLLKAQAVAEFSVDVVYALHPDHLELVKSVIVEARDTEKNISHTLLNDVPQNGESKGNISVLLGPLPSGRKVAVSVTAVHSSGEQSGESESIVVTPFGSHANYTQLEVALISIICVLGFLLIMATFCFCYCRKEHSSQTAEKSKVAILPTVASAPHAEGRRAEGEQWMDNGSDSLPILKEDADQGSPRFSPVDPSLVKMEEVSPPPPSPPPPAPPPPQPESNWPQQPELNLQPPMETYWQPSQYIAHQVPVGAFKLEHEPVKKERFRAGNAGRPDDEIIQDEEKFFDDAAPQWTLVTGIDSTFKPPHPRRPKRLKPSPEECTFVCEAPGCDKRFKYKRGLRRHQKVAHLGGYGINQTFCLFCKKNFTQKSSLQRHQDTQKHLKNQWKYIYAQFPQLRKSDYFIGEKVIRARLTQLWRDLEGHKQRPEMFKEVRMHPNATTQTNQQHQKQGIPRSPDLAPMCTSPTAEQPMMHQPSLQQHPSMQQVQDPQMTSQQTQAQVVQTERQSQQNGFDDCLQLQCPDDEIKNEFGMEDDAQPNGHPLYPLDVAVPSDPAIPSPLPSPEQPRRVTKPELFENLEDSMLEIPQLQDVTSSELDSQSHIPEVDGFSGLLDETVNTPELFPASNLTLDCNYNVPEFPNYGHSLDFEQDNFQLVDASLSPHKFLSLDNSPVNNFAGQYNFDFPVGYQMIDSV